MKNNFLISILLILLSALLFATFSKPWFQLAQAKYTHISDLRGVLAQAESLQQKRDVLQSTYNSISPGRINLVKNSIPEHSPSNIIRFLLALNSLIQVSGFPSNTSYSVGAEKEDSEIVIAVPITFNFAEVDYNQLLRFISNLQRWERGTKIASLRIEPPVNDATGQSNSVRALLVVDALFSRGSRLE